jgi:hypothetical protein
MNPRRVLPWLPVVREIVGLIQMAVEAGRRRRAKRRRECETIKRLGVDS